MAEPPTSYPQLPPIRYEPTRTSNPHAILQSILNNHIQKNLKPTNDISILATLSSKKVLYEARLKPLDNWIDEIDVSIIPRLHDVYIVVRVSKGKVTPALAADFAKVVGEAGMASDQDHISEQEKKGELKNDRPRHRYIIQAVATAHHSDGTLIPLRGLNTKIPSTSTSDAEALITVTETLTELASVDIVFHSHPSPSCDLLDFPGILNLLRWSAKKTHDAHRETVAVYEIDRPGENKESVLQKREQVAHLIKLVEKAVREKMEKEEAERKTAEEFAGVMKVVWEHVGKEEEEEKRKAEKLAAVKKVVEEHERTKIEERKKKEVEEELRFKAEEEEKERKRKEKKREKNKRGRAKKNEGKGKEKVGGMATRRWADIESDEEIDVDELRAELSGAGKDTEMRKYCRTVWESWTERDEA